MSKDKLEEMEWWDDFHLRGKDYADRLKIKGQEEELNLENLKSEAFL